MFLLVTYRFDIYITDEFRQPYGIKSIFGRPRSESWKEPAILKFS
jgi:hypothetical protein